MTGSFARALCAGLLLALVTAPALARRHDPEKLQ